MDIQIISISKSSRKNKRFQVKLTTGEVIHFGDINGSTYIDHKSKTKRDNYIFRHLSNPLEHDLISNLIMSPSILSLYILWGRYTDIYSNIIYLNKLLREHK